MGKKQRVTDVKGIMDLICLRCRRKIQGRRLTAVQDYAEGVPIVEISRTRGISRETIYKALRAARGQILGVKEGGSES